MKTAGSNSCQRRTFISNKYRKKSIMRHSVSERLCWVYRRNRKIIWFVCKLNTSESTETEICTFRTIWSCCSPRAKLFATWAYLATLGFEAVFSQQNLCTCRISVPGLTHPVTTIPKDLGPQNFQGPSTNIFTTAKEEVTRKLKVPGSSHASAKSVRLSCTQSGDRGYLHKA